LNIFLDFCDRRPSSIGMSGDGKENKYHHHHIYTLPNVYEGRTVRS